MKLQKVVKVEMVETVTERIVKSKRHDYARGGYKIEETIQRTTVKKAHALLDCGHWRQEHNHGTVILNADRLECFECFERAKAQSLPATSSASSS